MIYVILVVNTIISLFFVYLLATSKKHDDMIAPLDEKSFPLKLVYGVGFRLLELMKFKYDGQSALKLRRDVVVIYGDKYADYYLRVLYAQRIALSYTVLIIASNLACMAEPSDSIMLFVLGAIVAAAVYYYFVQQSSKLISERSNKYMIEFPSIVSSLALLVNAGLALRESWDIIAEGGNSDMHKQMQQVTIDRIKGGFTEIDAMSAMAKRCATPEISKMISLVIQALNKDGRDLAYTLMNQSDELWGLKQQKLLQEGEKASSKLLIPILIMFVGILMMVMIPIMSSLNI